MARTKKSAIFAKVISYLLLLAVLFSVYLVTAYIGLRLNAVSGFATLIWAPSGISLAALILFGFRVWPAVALGAFLINYSQGAPLYAAVGIAAGNTLEALVGAFLLRSFGFHSSLEKINDVLKLIMIGGVISTLVSATIGSSSLLVHKIITPDEFVRTWTVWWVGDMLGDLIVTPLILAWAKGKNLLVSINKRFEALAWIISVALSGILVFGRFEQFNPLSFLVFPPLVWGALRFNIAFNSFATFILSLIAFWGTLRGFGLFVFGDISTRLLFLQLFIGILAVANMLLTAAVSDSRSATEEVKKLNSKLRDKMKEVERLNKLMVGYIKKDRSEKIKSKKQPEFFED